MVSSAAPDLSVPVRRELFGGAIEMHVPERFSDISDFRQVPDHQECFADGIIDQSLMVELLDHKEEVRDEESARFFYEDLVSDKLILSEYLYSQFCYTETYSPSSSTDGFMSNLP